MNSVRAVSPDALKGMGVLLSITVARASSCRFCQPVCVSQKKKPTSLAASFVWWHLYAIWLGLLPIQQLNNRRISVCWGCCNVHPGCVGC